MKDKTLIWLLACVFLLGIIVANAGRCDRIPEGMVLVKQSFLDSLQLVADMPPDTVKVDSIIQGPTVYVDKPVPVPVYINPGDTLQKIYRDSIRAPGINARVDMKVYGRLTGIRWQYTPITNLVTYTIEKKVPYPVRYEVPVKVPQTGMYLELGLGRGFDKSFAGSAELFILTKKGALIGGELGYLQQPYFQFKVGAPIRFAR